MAKPNPEFSARLLGLLAAKGLSQREFAKAVGITEPSAHKYCRNGGVPEWDILLRIANFFSVSVDWLLTGREAEKKVVSASSRWMKAVTPRLEALDKKGQTAINALLDAIAPRAPEEQTTSPPRKAAAGPARARRR